MKFSKLILACLFAFSFLNAGVLQNQKVKEAINVLNAFVKTNENNITNDIKAVAILPSLTKAGLLATISKSEGIFVAKNDEGEWSSPFFVNYTGGSVGPQGGVISSDMIILFRNSRAYADIFDAKDTISLNVEASVINAGARKGVATDVPEISAYMLNSANSSGLFIGANLELARLSINKQDMIDYYERIYLYEDIYNNSPKDSKYTKKLKEILGKNFK